MPVVPTTTYVLARVTTDDSGCWIWQGKPDRRGYGRAGSHSSAHRLSYEVFQGEIPPGFEVDHLCRVPLCVNPGHLEAVTPEENRRRQTAAHTHCKHGHELTPGNVYTAPGQPNHRLCITCDRTVYFSAHGTLRRYNKGCRCDPCVTVKREYRLARVAVMGWAAA